MNSFTGLVELNSRCFNLLVMHYDLRVDSKEAIVKRQRKLNGSIKGMVNHDG